jgi:hypothetical protein
VGCIIITVGKEESMMTNWSSFFSNVSLRRGQIFLSLIILACAVPLSGFTEFGGKPVARLSIAFPTSNTELHLVFSTSLDRESAETVGNYTTAAGLQILNASLNSDDPRRVTLTTEEMDGTSLSVDAVQVKGLKGARGVIFPEMTSPAFLHGIASIEALRRAHEEEFPYASLYAGVVATLSCSKNGGVWEGVNALGFTFLHEESGGPYSSIKVVTDIEEKIPNVAEEHHELQEGESLHVLWAGGIILEVNAETQLVDTGFMEGSLLPVLRTPPEYLIKASDISGKAARTVTAKSLEGVIVRLENVVFTHVERPDELGIRSAVLTDESGAPVDALLLSPVTMAIEPGQSFLSVRALVVRPKLDLFQLLIEWDGALEEIKPPDDPNRPPFRR